MRCLILAALFLPTLSTGAIEMCEIDGIPTYTDRIDVCDGSGEAVAFDQGTFSLVEIPQPPQELASVEPAPRVVTVERIVERYVPVVIEVGETPASPRYLPVVVPGRHHRYGFDRRRHGHGLASSLAAPRTRGVVGIEDDVAWPTPARRSKPAIPVQGSRRGH